MCSFSNSSPNVTSPSPGRGQGRNSQERKEENIQIFLARQKKQGPVLCLRGRSGDQTSLDHSIDLCLEPLPTYIVSYAQCLDAYLAYFYAPTHVGTWDQISSQPPTPHRRIWSNENAIFDVCLISYFPLFLPICLSL